MKWLALWDARPERRIKWSPVENVFKGWKTSGWDGAPGVPVFVDEEIVFSSDVHPHDLIANPPILALFRSSASVLHFACVMDLTADEVKRVKGAGR